METSLMMNSLLFEHVFKPAKGFRLDVEVGSKVFLRYSLQQFGILMYKVKEPFPGAKAYHIGPPFVPYNHRKGNHQPAKSFHIGTFRINLFQVIIINRYNRGRLNRFNTV